MFPFRKFRARRVQIRSNRPDLAERWWNKFMAADYLVSLGVAAIFWLAASAIVFMRQDVPHYRPGEHVSQTILSRVDFTFHDDEAGIAEVSRLRSNAPVQYKISPVGSWDKFQSDLAALPSQLKGKTLANVDKDLAASLSLDNDSIQLFNDDDFLARYDALASQYRNTLQLKFDALIFVDNHSTTTPFQTVLSSFGKSDVDQAASIFPQLQTTIKAFTNAHLATDVVETATVANQNVAAALVPDTAADKTYAANQPIVFPSQFPLTDQQAKTLPAQEEAAYYKQLPPGQIIELKLGLTLLVLLITTALAAYVIRYQPRILRNHARAGHIVGMLISMLFLAQLAAVGTGPLYLFGIAPTIMVAMILTIAYDQRFAAGVGAIQAILVTIGLDQGIEFMVVSWVGVLTCCYLLNEVRSRSKPIEVGAIAAIAMMVAAAAAGLLRLDPIRFVGLDCIYAGAAGLGVGFIVLGILPFIEQTFRITTSMTLLELADVSRSLLKRLQLEAPGTYSHSLQVATLAEAAAESIGANALLARVGSYYHDIGKMNKPDYFSENQSDGRNRHLNLSPNVSLLIIIGHVKDGLEMAREYNLPTVLFHFIQQHHGTTLVEHFYNQACRQKDPLGDQSAVSETQYRYPGPKPRGREVAICMLADAVESATRSMPEPNASRIENLVHELAMKRLLDGQFDECPITLRELEIVEKSMIKTLLGIYHGRLSYPSTRNLTHGPLPTRPDSDPDESPNPSSSPATTVRSA